MFDNFFPFFSTTNRSRDRREGGGVFEHPPPSRWWKIWSASGTRVNAKRC